MKTTQSRSTYPELPTDYRTVDILTVSTLMLAAMFAFLVVLSYPVTAGGVVIGMLAAGLLTRGARRRQGRASLRRVLTAVSNAFTGTFSHLHRLNRRV